MTQQEAIKRLSRFESNTPSTLRGKEANIRSANAEGWVS